MVNHCSVSFQICAHRDAERRVSINCSEDFKRGFADMM